jgi:tetratricopeptide (TPR) repeat protein/DNA-binding CsgD family transcriptional regulator
MKKTLYLLFVLIGIQLYSRASIIDSLKLELNKTSDLSLHRADIYNKIGNSYYLVQDYSKAIDSKKAALKIYTKLHDFTNQILCLEQLGIYYADISDFEKSVSYLFEGLRLVDKRKNTFQYNSLLFNLGTTYLAAGNTHQGLNYLKRTLKYYKKQHHSYKLAAVYSNCGAAYMGLEDLKNSRFYFDKALQIGLKNNYLAIIGAAYINLGNIHYEKKEYQEALLKYNLAIDFCKKGADERGISHTNIGIANVYNRLKEFPEALEIYKKCILYFREKNDLNELVPALKSVSEIYTKMGDVNQSYFYFKEYSKMKDKLSKEEVLNKMAILKLKFDTEKLEKNTANKIELLEKKRKIDTLKVYVLLGICLIVVLVVIIFYTKNKYQKKILQNNRKEKAYLEEELKYRFSELEFFALHIVQKNNLLNELKADFKALKGKESTSTAINSIVLKINNTIKKNKELELFSKRVDEVNASFYKVLETKFPDLTNNEKKLCTLIKLNLSSKEIAVLNDVTEGAITMARYRLRKKIGIEHDENLTDFFHNIG